MDTIALEEDMPLLEEINDSFPLVLLKERGMESQNSPSSAVLSNHRILQLSALLFALFVVAEIIGALVSGSLSLLGDSAAMSVDVLTYIANMYAEHLKNTHCLSERYRKIVYDIMVPLCALLTLLGVTGWITAQAVVVIHNSNKGQPEEDDVPISYLFGFSLGNLVIDVLCNWFFYSRGEDVFFHCDGQTPGISEESDIELDESNLKNSTKIGIKSSVAISSVKNIVHADKSLSNLDALENVNYESLKSRENDSSNNEIPVIRRKTNMNMWSAFAHVSGDTIRTITVLSAATISVTTGIDGSLCDAWAAVVCAVTILGIALILIRELWKTLHNVD